MRVHAGSGPTTAQATTYGFIYCASVAHDAETTILVHGVTSMQTAARCCSADMRFAWMFLIGCATAPPPRVAAPREPVLVRMARPDDALPLRDAFTNPICANGAIADDLVEPLVAFARAHLVRGDARLPIRVHRRDRKHAPWRDGTVIRLDPRAATSGISVATIINGYSSGTTYCAYVQHQAGTTVILVREDGVWVQ